MRAAITDHGAGSDNCDVSRSSKWLMRSIVVLKNTIGEREAYRWVSAHPTAMNPCARLYGKNTRNTVHEYEGVIITNNDGQ